jgi:aldehyde dehydrogenase (NAD+)
MSKVRHPDHLYIGGQWVVPSTTALIDVVTPSTENLFIRVAEAKADDVDLAVQAARKAFDEGPWPHMTHAERASFLRAIARGIRERSEDLAAIWTSEVGVVNSFSRAVVEAVASAYEYYALLAYAFPFIERHTPSRGNGFGLLIREPVGVVAAIIPWNSPLSTIAYKVAPALLAGCTVIVKSSPEAPCAAYVMAEIAAAVGLPAGVFNVLTADREISERLVRNPGVDKITFTGSNEAGKKIGAICADRVARCTLELGGKSAAIVLDDYDLEAVAALMASSASAMAGQVCSSLTRVVVTRERHDRLVEAMVESFGAIRVGDPFDVSTQMGPLATARQRSRVERYIELGRVEGAVLAAGGGRPAELNRGFYVQPTLFSKVDNSMTIAREEIFGPVVSVIPADSEAQAVEIANDSLFGLNASIFTNDLERAYHISRRIRAGTVGHNSFRTDFSIAFGGFKQSGIGREGGTEGLLPFLESKTVILDGQPTAVPNARFRGQMI